MFIGQTYHIKISLFQRVSNLEYIGELYVDKDYKEGEKNGRTCRQVYLFSPTFISSCFKTIPHEHPFSLPYRFPLGSRLQASHYIQQFSEIFTEEGRKSVKITHLVPGHPARVTCTPGMRERERDVKAQAQAKALARSTLAAVTSTTNSPMVRSPSTPVNQMNSSANNIANSSIEQVAGPSANSNTPSLASATNNVNLVTALSSPPMSNNYTNILNSTLTGAVTPALNSTQPVVCLNTSLDWLSFQLLRFVFYSFFSLSTNHM